MTARAFLLAAGRGMRFRPVTERIPKPLLPFLNVPLARAHLERLRRAGVSQAGVNLHHLGDEVEQSLSEGAAEMPELVFFREANILGTAGALRNARGFLDGGDFLLINSDAAIEPDFRALLSAHRSSGRPASLLVVENRQPERYTPLQAEGDRITGFGVHSPRPLLYTGVCVLSSELLERIAPGQTQLVADLWAPMLADGLEIGFVLHEGPFADLGSPGDFLRASLEALERGGRFPRGAGSYDRATRVLALDPPSGFEASASVLGRGLYGSGVRLEGCVAFSGTRIDSGARLERCLVAGGQVPARATFADALLWPGPDGVVAALPLS